MRRRDAGFTVIELLVCIIVAGIIFAIVFPIYIRHHPGPPANTDPRYGWTKVDDSIEKRCDGTTMLYRERNTASHGLTASPNNVECSGR